MRGLVVCRSVVGRRGVLGRLVLRRRFLSGAFGVCIVVGIVVRRR